jgi:phenylacetaldehyde dehydrogenase
MAAAMTPTLSTPTQAFLDQEHRLLINNEWVATEGGETIAVHDPATGLQITEHQGASENDVDRAVAAARAALNGPWSRMSPADRGKLLWRLADLMEEHAQTICELEVLNNGMPMMAAQIGSTVFAPDYLRYCAGWATKILGDTISTSRPPMDPNSETLVYTLKEPIGVVGAIIPWNHPGSMMTLKLGPAMATGCTLVLKVSELTPLTNFFMAQLAVEAGFPPGVINVISGYGERAGAALANHPDVDKIAFTGSTAVGKEIIRASAGNLKRVTLELGGKSPVVVMPDADIDKAVAGAIPAAFFLSGQNCMAGTRLFLHSAIHDEFVDKLTAGVGMLKIGSGFDPESFIGPLISARQQQRVLGYIDAARRDGAEIVAGGNATGEHGFFVEPTVATGTTQSMQVVREEVFGPVLSVRRFDTDDLDEIAAEANDTVYGLSGSVWTQNITTAHRLVKRIDSGQVSINCHAAIDPATPFGGNKQSGWGREFGKDGLQPYLKTKAVTVML